MPPIRGCDRREGLFRVSQGDISTLAKGDKSVLSTVDSTPHSVFNSDPGQEIRLPKDVALPEHVKKVDVIALSNTRVITPAGQAWDAWFDSEGVSADFMNERDQPEQVDP